MNCLMLNYVYTKHICHGQELFILVNVLGFIPENTGLEIARGYPATNCDLTIQN